MAARLPSEFRTPALGRLRFRRPLLPTGPPATIEDATLRHAAEAAGTRLGFTQLREVNRAALLAF